MHNEPPRPADRREHPGRRPPPPRSYRRVTAPAVPSQPTAPSIPPAPTGPPPELRAFRPDRDDEVRLCGTNACLAVFRARRDDIVRVHVASRRVGAFAALLRWCAENRRAYHVVEDADIGRLTQSTHHEGICLVVRRPAPLDLASFLAAEATTPAPRCVLVLDNVTNPHNLGAIVRTAAHFGAAAVLLTGPADQVPTLSAAVHRTAEGGLETVPVLRAADGPGALCALRQAGYALLATSSHATASLHAAPLPAKTAFLLGAEAEGLSLDLRRWADRTVVIPGTGAVESLNVASAAAVLLAEFRRLHGFSPAAVPPPASA